MQRTSNLKRAGTVFLLTMLVFILLLSTVKDIGLTWDEPAYIAASESYMNWFEQVAAQPGRIADGEFLEFAWKVNSEHPPLDKIWSGLVWSITRNFSDDLSAHRVGNMLLVALMAGLLYVLIQGAYGQAAGFGAVAALLSMPRFFFHAHLAALDVPAAVSVFFVTFVFWKTLEKGHWAWGLVLGVCWGLALATKINAVFIPVTLGLWWLIFRRDGRTFVRLVLMGVTAVPVFVAVWPWLYTQTFEHLKAYILFVTTEHWQIGQYYLGQFYMPPPWHFGFVMMWAVLPLSLIILFGVGVARARKGKQDQGLGWLLFLSALTPILAISSGKSMVYDNERLMMAAFPFVAGLAGAGLGWVLLGCKKLLAAQGKPVVTWTAYAAAVLLAFAPQLVSMAALYPHYLSYYGQGVGGAAGAARLGLESTYWCESYRLALPIINKEAEPGDVLWSDPWSHDVLIYYQMHGMLRDDLVILSPMNTQSVLGMDAPQPRALPVESADWYLFQHRQSTLGEALDKNGILDVLRARQKVYEYSFEGVPIFTLYK